MVHKGYRFHGVGKDGSVVVVNPDDKGTTRIGTAKKTIGSQYIAYNNQGEAVAWIGGKVQKVDLSGNQDECFIALLEDYLVN